MGLCIKSREQGSGIRDAGTQGGRRWSSFGRLSSPKLFVLLFTAVAFAHLTLLRLPYFWDEGGYYIPAALDFYQRWTLIPHFTNAHPPLPNVVLGLLWHLVGYHIVATRLAACAFAAAGLLGVLRMTQRLLDDVSAVVVTGLVAVYPIWFAQSSLAHADIFAAAFTLGAFAAYFADGEEVRRRQVLVAVLFSLAALSKETAIVQPAALGALQLALLVRGWRSAEVRKRRLGWIMALSAPLLPLVSWYGYHRGKTGFMFGNPEYLRYNATANLTAGHVVTAFRYRFLHLFWQRNIWLPVLLALACLFLPERVEVKRLRRADLVVIGWIVAANWVAFSVLGGALLTRYLLPVYPLILLVCVATWRSRTRLWPVFAGVTAVAFVSALWVNPPTSFAPEDNLTYRDMIVVHQEAIDYVNGHYPEARVLTAWPVAADVFRPELGYTQRPIRAVTMEDFTLPSVEKAAKEADTYDTAIVFTTHFVTPSFRRYLMAHPDSRRGREFAATRDLSPEEIAAILHGSIVWQDDRNGEWAAVLRFDRSYEARLR